MDCRGQGAVSVRRKGNSVSGHPEQCSTRGPPKPSSGESGAGPGFFFFERIFEFLISEF